VSFDRLGRLAVRRRWWIVAAWALLIIAAIPFAPRAPGALSAGGFILDDLESARAKQVLQEELVSSRRRSCSSTRPTASPPARRRGSRQWTPPHTT
jgi:hypothetical protein